MRPCPFCGKADDLSRNLFSGDFVCDACGASVDEGSWNNRPVEDELREALSQIVGAVPVFGAEGGCFYEHFGAEGEHMGTEYVDPTAVIQRIDELARAALNLAKTGAQQ